VSITSCPDPDIPVITSMRHVVNEIRGVWERRRRLAAYLVVEGGTRDEAEFEVQARYVWMRLWIFFSLFLLDP
jgi:hypothetical protein